AFLVAVLLLPNPASSQKAAEESDEFFKSGKVLQLALEVGPKETDSLRRDARRYVKATLKEGDKVVYKDVGVHLKGAAGSFRGNFYDGGFLRDIDQPLQLIRTKEDVKDRADLKALIAAAGERDLKVRFEKMEKLLALDRFLSYLCMEVITCDWDSYPLNRNNYRIYHDPKSNKITFIPSEMYQMFGDTNSPVLPGFQGMIARGLVETPEGRKRYLARMEEIM